MNVSWARQLENFSKQNREQRGGCSNLNQKSIIQEDFSNGKEKKKEAINCQPFSPQQKKKKGFFPLYLFHVHHSVSANKNNKGSQVLQTKRNIIPSWRASINEWSSSVCLEEQYQLCLGILIILLLRTRTVELICFSYNTWSNKSPVRVQEMVLLRSHFENHFPSLAAACQSGSTGEERVILPM